MREAVKNGRKPLQIMIADDTQEIRRLLEMLLSEIDGVAICGKAENGAEALRLARENHPDLLVLDVSMPDMSGIEVLQQIRKNDQSMIVVMFTIESQLRDYCLKAGANYFFSKNEIGDLVEIIQMLLRQRRT